MAGKLCPSSETAAQVNRVCSLKKNQRPEMTRRQVLVFPVRTDALTWSFVTCFLLGSASVSSPCLVVLFH